MDRFLIVFVSSLGCATLLLLVFPWAVFFGLLALVVPGLAMMATPTAFLWMASFSLFWFALHRGLGDGIAAIVAAVLTVLLMVALPAPSALLARMRIQSERLPDVRLPEPLVPTGHIRLDLAGLDKGCDAVCAALLFSQGVDSVTVSGRATATRPKDRTYRLVRRRPGSTGGIVPDLETRSDIFGGDPSRREHRTSSWLARLGATHQIVQEPARQGFDLTFSETSTPRLRQSKERWWPLPSESHLRVFQITDGTGTVLARTHRVAVWTPRIPLLISWYAEGQGTTTGFAWARTTVDDGKSPEAALTLVEGLLANTVLFRASPEPPDQITGSLEQSLREATNDPDRSPDDPVFTMLSTYIDGMSDTPTDEQIALLRAALRDTRFRKLWRSRHLAEIFEDDLSPFRDAMVDRIANGPDDDQEAARDLGRWLDRHLPPGSFDPLRPQEEALLSDPELRLRAPALVHRLSDHGASAVPRLLDLLTHHAERARAIQNGPRSKRRQALRHLELVRASGVALCRLGPRASEARDTIERVSTDGTVPENLVRRAGWTMLRARLGTPVEKIIVDGQQVERKRENLRRRLAEPDPSGHCQA